MVDFSSVSAQLVAFVNIPVVFFIINNVELERKDTVLSAVKRKCSQKVFFIFKDVFCLDL